MIRIRVRTSDQWIRIRETQKLADPVLDPDPQHWWDRVLKLYSYTVNAEF
jgi:hypothetical protein